MSAATATRSRRSVPVSDREIDRENIFVQRVRDGECNVTINKFAFVLYRQREKRGEHPEINECWGIVYIHAMRCAMRYKRGQMRWGKHENALRTWVFQGLKMFVWNINETQWREARTMLAMPTNTDVRFRFRELSRDFHTAECDRSIDPARIAMSNELVGSLPRDAQPLVASLLEMVATDYEKVRRIFHKHLAGKPFWSRPFRKKDIERIIEVLKSRNFSPD